MINNRPKDAPLLVVLDWELSLQELNQTAKAYGAGGATKVTKMDAAHCHQEMGDDFKGIERFYPPTLVRNAAAQGGFVVADVAGHPISISAKELTKAKHQLKTDVLKVASLADIPQLDLVVRDVVNA